MWTHILSCSVMFGRERAVTLFHHVCAMCYHVPSCSIMCHHVFGRRVPKHGFALGPKNMCFHMMELVITWFPIHRCCDCAPEYNNWTHLMNEGGYPMRPKTENMKSWSILSKAFSKSRKTSAPSLFNSPLSYLSCMFSIISCSSIYQLK